MKEYFYKKIAIISDNPEILSRFFQVADELGLQRSYLHTFCSPGTSIEIFEGITNIPININLKKHFSYFLENKFDLIFSLHCKQIFPEALTTMVKCINVHPGYNPINRGWYPQVFAIINNLEVGATIHEMDKLVDHGKIIDREKITINAWDTSYTVYNHIVDSEIRLVKRNLVNILNNNFKTITPEGEGNYFSKNDFNDLCEIKLSEKADYKTVINRLRALSHDGFRNAWFIDENTGKKVYVSINLDVN